MPRRLTPNERIADTMSELELEKNVINLAEANGWRVYSVRRSDMAQPNGTTHKGFPDLVMARKGKVIFAELKTRKGTLSDQQNEWLAVLHSTETPVFVWRTTDWVDGTITLDLAKLSATPHPTE